MSMADVTESPAQLASHREIAARHKRGKRPPATSVRMLRELRKFFSDRYDKFGPAMPEGDDGALDDFLILLNYVAMLGDHRALRACKARWMPSQSEAAFDAMVADVVCSPLYLSPDALGERIGLTDTKRTELRIRSIGGIGCTKAQRVDRRKALNTAARKAKRQADRALCPAKVSASESMPWVALGMCRSSWHAKGKPQLSISGQNLSAVSLLYVADNICPNVPTGASPSGESAAAAGLSQSQAFDADIAAASKSKTVLQTKRESAVAARLRLQWVKTRSDTSFDLYRLHALTTEMGRVAA